MTTVKEPTVEEKIKRLREMQKASDAYIPYPNSNFTFYSSI